MKPTASHLFTGTAFVVFKRPIDVHNILLSKERGICSKARECFKKNFRGSKREEEIKVESNIKIQRAPEPTDVYWENLEIK